MSGRRPHPATLAALSALLIVLVVAVGVFLAAPPDSREGAVAIGVASSLLASAVYATVDGLLNGTKRRELQDLLANAAELSRSARLLAEADQHGISGIRPKRAYSEEEWLALLRGAHRSLTMVGHALDKWCEGEIEKEFGAAIRRVVSNGGEVRLLMLADGANRVPGLRQKKYGARIARTKQVLARVSRDLSGPGALRAYQLGDGIDMPYMAVSNETSLITSPYPARTQSSERMPTVRLSTQSEIAKQLAVDIDALFDGRVSEIKF